MIINVIKFFTLNRMNNTIEWNYTYNGYNKPIIPKSKPALQNKTTKIKPGIKKGLIIASVVIFICIICGLIGWGIYEVSKNTTSPTAPPTISPVAPTKSPTMAPRPSPTAAPTPSPTEPAPTSIPNASEYCGPDTVFDPGTGKCTGLQTTISELEPVINELINAERIISITNVEKFGETPQIMYIPEDQTVLSNKYDKSRPDWFQHFIDNGGEGCNKFISTNPGANDNTVGCSCGECAGWRGGNVQSCGGQEISEKLDEARLVCIQGTDPLQNSCACDEGYCPVGGLCVTPFKEHNNGKKGCPSCIYTSIKDGGCAGVVKCDPTLELLENTVDYPGTRYECNDNGENCKLSEEYKGMNEYECAYKCMKKYNNQYECSKKCLPKLWVWEKYESNGEYKGYYQTGELAAYVSKDYELNNVCPSEGCIETDDSNPDPNQPPDVKYLNNCQQCSGCDWKFNSIINGYDYSCDKCDVCHPFPEEDGTIVYDKCMNAQNCRSCKKTFNISQGTLDAVECEYCKSKDSTTQCIKYTDMETPNVSVDYNKGNAHDPSNYRANDEDDSACYFYTNSFSCSGNSPKPGLYDGGVFKLNFWTQEYTTLKDYQGECNKGIKDCKVRL